MQKTILLMFDEIDRLGASIRERLEKKQITPEECSDEVLDFLMYCYLYGNVDANDDLDLPQDKRINVDNEAMFDTIDTPIAGKTYKQRVMEYALSGDADALQKVLDTEAHRVYNESAISTARKGGATSKTWVTMLDNKVRETHDYLEGMTVGVDERFYTYDGDSAEYPGGFDDASNNINCRCALKFSK